MKIYKYLVFIFLPLLGLFNSCINNEPTIDKFPNENVSFNYKVVGDYAVDYLIESQIQFVNTSELSGECVWDFGDGSPEVTAPSPSHIYKKAGTYTVKLTVAGEYTSRILLISDLFPTISVVDPGQICEVGKSEIRFNVKLPNPGNQEIEYHWIFPEGTMDVNGNEIKESYLENPGVLKFRNIGSSKVVLQTAIGDKGAPKRSLEEGVINVQVGASVNCKTLYYAAKNGNLMAYKLVPVSGLPSGAKNNAFNLGVKSGQHPFNIIFNDSSVYILDCGKQFVYIDDQGGNLGDGKISAVWLDGSKVESVVTNVGGTAFNDPFYGYIEEKEKNLYYSDRNTGIRKMPLNTRNAILTPSTEYWVTNDRLGYYKNGYEYGAITSNFAKVNGVWWWNKTFNGMGIFRFVETDISKTALTGIIKAPDSGSLFGSFYVKSFIVDATKNICYFTVHDFGLSAGFYAVPLDQLASVTSANLTTFRKAALPVDAEGSGGEYVYISQLALDSEDGSVYFGYRSPDPLIVKSGLKRYNPVTGKVENVIDNVEIYGVTINNRKSKLF